MMPLSCATTIVCIFLSIACSAVAQDLAPQLSNRLVSLNGRRTQPVTDDPVKDAKYIALYYSAGWCGPCRAFTPELVKFYNENKAKIPGFEMVFMSQDRSEPEMEKYMADMSMPWPALRFTAVRTSSNLMKYAGPGIPCLVLLNDKGEVLSHSYEGKRYLGPGKVLAELSKLASGGAARAAAAAPASSVAPVPVGAPPAKAPAPDVKSPSGTNWDEVFKKKMP